jgi:hypothetical protein
MGVKSTVRLTRREAIDLYVTHRLADLTPIARSEAIWMSDKDLEYALEKMNDSAKGGEGFENYIID